MKKALSIIVALLPLVAGAQVIGTYSNQSAGRDDLKVELMKKNNKPEYVRFDAQTKSGYGEVWVKWKDLEKFRAALTEARDKYVEWSKVADDNNVKSLRKEIPVKFPKPAFWWNFGNDRFYDDYVGWKMTFSAVDKFRYAFMIAPAKGIRNRFVTETFEVTFMCVGDFDSLIAALDPAKAEAVAGNPADADLFK